MSSTRQEAISHWLTVAFMTVFGLGLMGWYAHGLRYGLASSRWPSAPATVTRAGAVGSEDEDHDWSYGPDVEYTYVVDGQTYTANRIGFMSDGEYDSSSMGSATEAARAWERKSDLRAFYDPSEPSRACLAPGAEFQIVSVFMVLLVGGGSLFIGLWMAKSGPS